MVIRLRPKLLSFAVLLAITVLLPLGLMSTPVLVRPDGFVAWRNADVSDDPTRELTAALSQLLAVGGRPRETAGQTA